MYFCPHWEDSLIKEINFINHNFYFSGTMIEHKSAYNYDCGKN